MGIVQKYPLLGSSVNPEKLALTIKGVLIAGTSAVIILAGWLKIDIGAEDWKNLVELLWMAANQVIFAVGALLAVYGALRKLYYRIRNR